MKTTEEKMSIIHLENNHRKINTLETAFSIWSLQVCLFYYGYFQGVLRTWFLLLFSFHFMTFLKNMFREFGFAFCVSEVFPMFFKSCVEVSVGSSYIKFVAVGACQFKTPLPVIFVILFYFIYDYILQFVICFVGYFYIFVYYSDFSC